MVESHTQLPQRVTRHPDETPIQKLLVHELRAFTRHMFAKEKDVKVVTDAVTALKGPPLPWGGKARTWFGIAQTEIRKARSRNHHIYYNITEEQLRADNESTAPARPYIEPPTPAPVSSAVGDSSSGQLSAVRDRPLCGPRPSSRLPSTNRFVEREAVCADAASSDED